MFLYPHYVAHLQINTKPGITRNNPPLNATEENHPKNVFSTNRESINIERPSTKKHNSANEVGYMLK